jgi:hypothetical protein
MKSLIRSQGEPLRVSILEIAEQQHGTSVVAEHSLSESLTISIDLTFRLRSLFQADVYTSGCQIDFVGLEFASFDPEDDEGELILSEEFDPSEAIVEVRISGDLLEFTLRLEDGRTIILFGDLELLFDGRC